MQLSLPYSFRQKTILYPLTFLDSIKIQTGSLYLFFIYSRIMKIYQIIHRDYKCGILYNGFLPGVFRGKSWGRGAAQTNTQRF